MYDPGEFEKEGGQEHWQHSVLPTGRERGAQSQMLGDPSKERRTRRIRGEADVSLGRKVPVQCRGAD